MPTPGTERPRLTARATPIWFPICLGLAFTVSLSLVAQTPEASPSPQSQDTPQTAPSTNGPLYKPATTTAVTVTGKDDPSTRPEPTRILGILPNFRAVTAGTAPPPPSAHVNLRLATEQSLDYSAFVFGGLTSLISEARDTHPTFGKGPNGFGQYLWRNNVDRVDRNFQQSFLFPTLYREDPRYYAMEKGNVFHRVAYAASRTVITRTYSGRRTVNLASISGKLGSEAVSTTYYPKRDLSFSALGVRLGYSVAREAAFTTVREFYPDIAAHFRRRIKEPGSDPHPHGSPQPLTPRPPA